MGKIRPFRDTIPTLKRLRKDKKVLVLLSYGVPAQQNGKIGKLGIRRYFAKIIFDGTIGKSNKMPYIKKIISWLRKKGIRKDEIMIVGDRISSEIEAGKRLGITTVRMKYKHGRYRKLKPENRFQKADYEIKRISGLIDVVARS
jgi:FMN phosphatase YigB (HAD superfamily)